MPMNRIELRPAKTPFGYDEDYWTIDGKPITEHLERHRREDTGRLSLLGLLPAWCGGMNDPWENDFVWELVDSEEELNVPILICPDDCDFTCTVIMAHIRKTADTVYWDKIGRLDHTEEDYHEFARSGILCLEAYTDEDWERYGGDIAWAKFDSREYWDWVRENVYEENIRRLRNYMKPYMQQDKHIEWFWMPQWKFFREEYDLVVEGYRKLKELNRLKQ